MRDLDVSVEVVVAAVVDESIIGVSSAVVDGVEDDAAAALDVTRSGLACGVAAAAASSTSEVVGCG